MDDTPRSPVVPRNVGAHPRARNLYFYADIATFTEPEFIERFLALSIPELRAEILSQVWAKAHVVEAKFRNVRRAVALLFFAVSIWLAGRLLAALA